MQSTECVGVHINRIVVLFNGHASLASETLMQANCTCTIIIGRSTVTIVDTRTAWDGEALTNEMTKHDLRPADVTHVVCTHGHSDHTGCNYLFQDAKVHIVGHSVSNRETYYLHDFDTADYVIEEGIQVTATPGHTLDSVSVLVSPANIAQRVAVCGDLFEHSHDVEDSSQWIDAGSESPEQQRKSRQRIATDADIIIPGHGELFRVTDEIRAKLTRDMNE